MNPHRGATDDGEGRAAWLAFAGKAFLCTDAVALLAAVEELRSQPVPVAQFSSLLDDFEAALRDGAGDLEAAYVRVFLDPAGAPCPPWQSAHSSEPQLMGAAHHSALGWYRASGIQPKATNEPADHIGLLLTFTASLVRSGPEQSSFETFHREHLEWIPEYCQDVARESPHLFHALLADATRDLLAQLRSPQA